MPMPLSQSSSHTRTLPKANRRRKQAEEARHQWVERERVDRENEERGHPPKSTSSSTKRGSPHFWLAVAVAIVAVAIVAGVGIFLALPDQGGGVEPPEPPPEPPVVLTAPSSGYARCGSDAIKVYWFDRTNYQKRHLDITGEQATAIFGRAWWNTIGHMSQSACDSWPTGSPLTGRPPS